jgi:hypothetical protein
MRRLTAVVAAIAMTVALTPVSLGASSPALTGGVRGTVIENSGRSLGNRLQAQLVDSQGVAGATTAVDRDGSFAFNNVAPGIYTVQVIGAKGMSAVTVTAGRVALASVTVAVPVAGAPVPRMSTAGMWWMWGAIIGGGTVAGIAIYQANKDDASGSK